MKRNKNTQRLSNPPSFPTPALNVVVYRNPGPADRDVDKHAQVIVETRSPCGPGGLLYHMTLVESDFDRLWNGVDQGDAFGTAYSVLRLLDPNAQQFINRHDDFMFGWIGGADKQYGDVLLLQVIPRAHMLAGMN